MTLNENASCTRWAQAHRHLMHGSKWAAHAGKMKPALLPSHPAVLRPADRFSYEQYMADILEFENDKYQILNWWFWEPLTFFRMNTLNSKFFFHDIQKQISILGSPCVHTCICARVFMHMARGPPRMLLLWHCLPLLRRGLPVAWGLQIWLGWPVRKPQDAPQLPLSSAGSWGLQSEHCVQWAPLAPKLSLPCFSRVSSACF